MSGQTEQTACLTASYVPFSRARALLKRERITFDFFTFSSCCCCCRIKIKWAALCRGQVICIEGGSSSSISPLQCNWQVEAELPNGTETTAAAAIQQSENAFWREVKGNQKGIDWIRKWAIFWLSVCVCVWSHSVECLREFILLLLLLLMMKAH